MKKFLLMYDELVKRLRFYQDGTLYYKQAADAIEELSKKLDESIPKSDAEIIIEELSKPRWIPVTERLPEPFDRVIVYDKRWGVLPTMKGEDDSWSGRNDIVIEKVTHWMPLPEPPKEE